MAGARHLSVPGGACARFQPSCGTKERGITWASDRLRPFPGGEGEVMRGRSRGYGGYSAGPPPVPTVRHPRSGGGGQARGLEPPPWMLPLRCALPAPPRRRSLPHSSRRSSGLQGLLGPGRSRCAGAGRRTRSVIPRTAKEGAPDPAMEECRPLSPVPPPSDPLLRACSRALSCGPPSGTSLPSPSPPPRCSSILSVFEA